MHIIISPAKKMNIDVDSPFQVQLPLFLEEATLLKNTLQSMDEIALQKLWKCSDSLAAQNIVRLQNMDLQRQLTPAILAYEGIQYRYLAPHVMEQSHLNYLEKHLRILSGFYGVLRPFDGVTPYRLEMGSALHTCKAKTLYDFWGDKLALELTKETHTILNLSSQEYSRAILPHLPSHITCITCIFGECKGNKVVEKGTLCKMARGAMVRWMAEKHITSLEQVVHFNQLGYHFHPEHSSQQQYIFIKGDDTSC